MRIMNIYLAGSIDGLTYAEATGWRIEFTERLHKIFDYDDVIIFDPTFKLRRCNYKPDDIVDLKHFPEREQIKTFEDDIHAISQTNIGVINIQGNSKGTGTIFEIGYMYAKGIKLLGYIDTANPLEQHPFINNAVDLYRTKEDMFNAVIKYIKEKGFRGL